MSKTALGKNASKEDAKIAESCKQFEAIMWRQMLDKACSIFLIASKNALSIKIRLVFLISMSMLTSKLRNFRIAA